MENNTAERHEIRNGIKELINSKKLIYNLKLIRMIVCFIP